MDGDDFVVPNMLEIIEKYNEKHNFDLLLFSHISIRDKNIQQEKLCDFLNDYCELSLQAYMCQQPAVWKRVYRRSIFTHENLRFPTKIFYQDLATSPQFVMYVQNIGLIKEPLYYYVSHRGSAMHCKETNRFFEIFTAFDYVMNGFKNENMINNFYAELEWLAIQHVLYFSTFRVLRIGYYPEIIQKFEEYVKNLFPNYKENKYIAAEHEKVNPNALKLLLDSDYITLDTKYCRKNRAILKIKDKIWALRNQLINS